jgi:predicted ATPase
VYKQSDGYIIDPYKWSVLVVIHGQKTWGYLCNISAYGDFLETTEVDNPTDYRMEKKQEFIEIYAKPETIEKLKDEKDADVKGTVRK